MDRLRKESAREKKVAELEGSVDQASPSSVGTFSRKSAISW